MSKKPVQKQKRTQQDDTANKQITYIAIAVCAVLVIAAILYFAWPKPTPAVEEQTSLATALATGLKIEDLVVGTGKEAKTGDSISVAYTGWLQEKYPTQPFDSSEIHDKPFDMVLGAGDAIAGWDQGLVGMKVGGKRKLIVPPSLGYGAEGAGDGRIPPNATLVFEVELLNIQGPPAATLPPTLITELKIEDMIVGTGKEAKAGDTLRIHYTGWLENGTQFDSSIGGEPIEFILGSGRVIPGWEQGLVGMKVGGRRKLIIPPSLGYGEAGAGDLIPANAALIFEVELVEIK